MAMDAAPAGLDIDELNAFLLALPGVHGHPRSPRLDLSTTETALTATWSARGRRPGLLPAAQKTLHDRFGIEHATLQVGPAGRRLPRL